AAGRNLRGYKVIFEEFVEIQPLAIGDRAALETAVMCDLRVAEHADWSRCCKPKAQSQPHCGNDPSCEKDFRDREGTPVGRDRLLQRERRFAFYFERSKFRDSGAIRCADIRLGHSADWANEAVASAVEGLDKARIVRLVAQCLTQFLHGAIQAEIK